MRLPSASSLDRALACPTSCVLPRARTYHVRTERGTAVHEFLEDALSIGGEAALAKVPEKHRDFCSKIDLRNLPTYSGMRAAEVAFAWDHTTGLARELCRGRKNNPNDYKGPLEYMGVADVVAVMGDVVLVEDYKTGDGWVESPGRNKQLRFLGMAAALAYGKRAARLGVIKVREDAPPYSEYAEIDEWDIDDIQAELRNLARKIASVSAALNEGKTPDTSQGDWCTWCSSFDFCPPKLALVKAFAGGAFAGPWDQTTPEEIAAAYTTWVDMRRLVKRGETRLKEWAKDAPIPCGNGKVYTIRAGRYGEYLP